MKKILLVVLVGLVIFIIAALIRDPEKILPMREIRQATKSYGSCPSPFVFQMPVDLSKATSVLYPGQVRGGNYKAHGGFRFDGSRPNEITVTAPYDAEVIAGARYRVNGEAQYTFDFAHPCGIRYRFGHLLTLAPKFQAIAEKFPMPEGLDSRTTEVRPPIKVKQGEVIATAVGLNTGGPSIYGEANPFVDWGVYDYRQKNEASQRSDWPTLHAAEDSSWATYYNSDIYQFAVCWFDWIPPEDKAKVLSLPAADSVNGKTSDYCK